MNSLVPELIDRISSFLDRTDLKRTLLLSPAFQVAAENHSGAFANFSFKNFPQDGDQFFSKYSGRRLRYLRNIEVHIGLPALKASELGYLPCREPQTELDAKDELFTRELREVFEAIKRAETEAKNAGHGSGKVHLTIFTPYRLVDREFCRYRLSSAWRLHVLSPKSFPSVDSIHGLSICNPDVPPERMGVRCAKSRLDPRVTIDLARRLPNLEYLGCRLGVEEWRLPNADPARKHFEHDFEGCARDARVAFAEALGETNLPSSLREVQLDFFYDLREHLHDEQDEGGPDLVGASKQDLFSKSLCVLAQGLKRLDLKVKANAALFWPLQGETPFPSLETLSVMFHPMTPSGSWYFRGLAGRGANVTGYQITNDMYPPLTSDDPRDEEWHDKEILRAIKAPVYFRQIPNERTLYPFLEAFAKAAVTMKWLRAFSVWSPLAHGLAWGIAYARPGERVTVFSPGNEFSDSRQLWWKVGSWRPDDELHRLFQDIGHIEHDGKMLEYWNEGDEESFLTDQETFVESLAALPLTRLERRF